MGVELPPFQAFLEEHSSLVYRFLVASVGPDEADDCYQETFLAALKAYPSLRSADNLRGWILTVATRKAIDAGRSRRRRPEPVERIEDLAPPNGEVPLPEAADRLWEMVRGLPPRQRVALAHRVVLDRPYREVAEAMGSNQEAVRANVYQALRSLREAMVSS